MPRRLTRIGLAGAARRLLLPRSLLARRLLLARIGSRNAARTRLWCAPKQR